MKKLRKIAARIGRKWALTPEQADHLATVKFPCC